VGGGGVGVSACRGVGLCVFFSFLCELGWGGVLGGGGGWGGSGRGLLLFFFFGFWVGGGSGGVGRD